MMTIEFTCGYVASNVGMPAMAMQAHVGQCDNAECQAELEGEVAKHRNVVFD